MKNKSLDLEYIRKALTVKTDVRAGIGYPPKPWPVPLYDVALYSVPADVE